MSSMEAVGNEDRSSSKVKKETPIWRTLLEAAIIALLVHTLLVRPFFVPSGSMKPNLLVGDYILVNKFAYGYSKYSCYFAACPIEGRILGRSPERGDVVVFSNPGESNHGVPYVKRLIGLPNDTIKVTDGIVTINGDILTQQPAHYFYEPLTDYKAELYCPSKSSEHCIIEQFSEKLSDGNSYEILNFGEGALDNTLEFNVPEGHYFVMGDNRDNSNDSRADVGFVPEENLIGKAEFVVFSSSGSSLFQFWNWRSGRFFQTIN